MKRYDIEADWLGGSQTELSVRKSISGDWAKYSDVQAKNKVARGLREKDLEIIKSLKSANKKLTDEAECNRVSMLQYKSLRSHFSTMVTEVLGEGYYNIEHDVYNSDEECCKAITRKANLTVLQKLFDK